MEIYLLTENIWENVIVIKNYIWWLSKNTKQIVLGLEYIFYVFASTTSM